MENTKIILKSKEGKEYILEYNRQSVQQIEKMGFSIEEISKKPMTMFPLMFRGAFIKNHKYIKDSEITEIYDKISKKSVLHDRLMDRISECYISLSDKEDADNEGNADWEIV